MNRGGTPYGQASLDRACQQVLSADDQRLTLHQQATQMFRLADGRELVEAVVWPRLEAVGARAGIDAATLRRTLHGARRRAVKLGARQAPAYSGAVTPAGDVTDVVVAAWSTAWADPALTPAERAVVLAICQVALRAHRLSVSASTRQLAEAAGCSHRTVANLARRAALAKYAQIERAGSRNRGDATRWRLVDHRPPATEARSNAQHQATACGLRPVVQSCAALPLPGGCTDPAAHPTPACWALAYALALADRPLTATEAAQAARVHPGTARRHLGAMAQRGRVLAAEGRYELADWAAEATDLAAANREALHRRHQAHRAAYRPPERPDPAPDAEAAEVPASGPVVHVRRPGWPERRRGPVAARAPRRRRRGGPGGRRPR